jgi:L-seryl-tRNA(Ser) seleniumtransferase
MNAKSLRQIPSVDRILREIGETELPRPALLALVRRHLAELRKSHANALDANQLVAQIKASIDDLLRARLQPVINGTGIIIHTNFGRSPMSEAIASRIAQIASRYNNLEFDLSTGERRGRAAYLEHNLAALCGAEAATVVNNCAAALVLVLRHFASSEPRRQVIISRGELVQIGGGFRIPEILEASGAILREVGTTNKTSLSDYARAINKQTAMILKVHRSNFFMDGFVESADTSALAALAKKHRVPFVEDLGSGAMFDIDGEPTPSQVLKLGVDLVSFSGDKLLGGPQAGVIAGKAKLVAKLKRDPLFRALRCDKLVFAALQATIDLHLSGRAHEIPIVAMMRESNDTLSRRAATIVDALRDANVDVKVGAGKSQTGGGSLPRKVIPSVTIDIRPRGAGVGDLATALRRANPPIVGYVSGGAFKIDLRTVFESQDQVIVDALRAITRADER